jgi:hypothetical protein
MKGSEKVKEKQFFFEKKNQKTFAPEITHLTPTLAKLTKVFCGAFFQKSDRFLFLTGA